MLSNKVNYLHKLPRSVAIPVRNALVCPHYWQYAADYKKAHPVCDGVTQEWANLAGKMLSTYPGYSDLLIPEPSFAKLGLYGMVTSNQIKIAARSNR
jgi:hypothetical protein